MENLNSSDQPPVFTDPSKWEELYPGVYRSKDAVDHKHTVLARSVRAGKWGPWVEGGVRESALSMAQPYDVNEMIGAGKVMAWCVTDSGGKSLRLMKAPPASGHRPIPKGNKRANGKEATPSEVEELKAAVHNQGAMIEVLARQLQELSVAVSRQASPMPYLGPTPPQADPATQHVPPPGNPYNLRSSIKAEPNGQMD